MARPRFATLGTYLRAGAVRKGLIGGSGGWMAIGAVVWGPRLLRRLLGRRPEPTTSVRLDAGDGLEVRTYRPATRRERRAAGRR